MGYITKQQDVDRRLRKLEKTKFNFILLDVMHSAPDKPVEGMVIYADGTDWDPGSGAGAYYRSSSAWVFMG